MNYNWYFVINQAEFLASGLVSKEIQTFLVGIGLKTILVTRGNYVSIVVDDVMLSIGIGTSDANPFVFEDKAVLLNDEGDIFYGVPDL